MRLLEEIINGVLVICVLAKSIEMAESLPAGEESKGSDVSLLDHEQQANPPALYTGNAGSSAPSAGVQQAGQPTGVKQPLQRSVVKPVQYMAQAAPMPITAYPRPSYCLPQAFLRFSAQLSGADHRYTDHLPPAEYYVTSTRHTSDYFVHPFLPRCSEKPVETS